MIACQYHIKRLIVEPAPETLAIHGCFLGKALGPESIQGETARAAGRFRLLHSYTRSLDHGEEDISMGDNHARH